MSLIYKRRIWWEPAAGAKEYVVYVSLKEKPIDLAEFSWEETDSMISKLVVDKTELIIPDEWPEFPSKSGTYHIAITSRNEVGNQSDPLLLSGVFNFIAPACPAKGGIESITAAQQEARGVQPPTEPPKPQEYITIIQRGMKELDDQDELADTYLGQRAFPAGIHMRNSE
jgi:hypothetical protein